MRIIDADKLKAHYAWWKGGSREMTMDEAKSDFDTIIDLQPTVDVVPAEDYRSMEQTVYKLTQALAEAEPIKHGRWLWREEWFWGEGEKEPRMTFGCSECGHSMYTKHDTLNYCPNCGAKMQSTMGQVKVGVSIKKPTKRWDTCGLTEDSVLVDTGSRGEKVEKVGE